MFRKPRDQPAVTSQSPILPYTGRPPTPPSADFKSPPPLTPQVRTMASKPPTPVLGRSQTTVRGVGGSRITPAGKAKGKANGSILSFFKKTETPFNTEPAPKEEQTGLFFEDSNIKSKHVSPTQTRTPPRENGDISLDKAALRYNEDLRAVKRRRTSEHGMLKAVEDAEEAGDERGSKSPDAGATRPSPVDSGPANHVMGHSPEKAGGLLVNTATKEQFDVEASNNKLGNGPFVEDPESDDDMIRHWTASSFEEPKPLGKLLIEEVSPPARLKSEPSEDNVRNVPSLHREGTSIVGGDGFEGMEDFFDDEFPEDGEEYMERLWMEEQQGLELGLEDDSIGDDLKGKSDDTPGLEKPAQGDEGTSACPICNESLEGFTPEVSHSEHFMHQHSSHDAL